MSLATAATYRNKFKNKCYNNTPVWIINTYKVVMYMQRSHHIWNIHIPDDGQSQTESTMVPSNYGSFINQFPLDIIKSMRQLKKTYTKMSLYCK